MIKSYKPPKPLHFIFLTLLFILSATSILAQAPDAEVDFYLIPPQDGSPLTVGDYITLRLEVKHPADSRVDLPVVDEVWGDLEVVNQNAPTTVQNSDGTFTTGKNIIVAAYEPGQYQTESLVVSHQKGDGTIEELGAPIIPINIESILVEGDEELRDLKSQAELPLPPLWPIILASFIVFMLLGMALTGAGLWFYQRWKRQQLNAPELVTPAIIDIRPPEVIAYAELNRIEALNLPTKNQFKEHYSLTTDCLRKYIEDRYQITALEQTTAEIRTSFRLSQISAAMVNLFMNIFVKSDFVKFARYRPDQQDARYLIAEARTLVQKTTPVPEPLAEKTQPQIEPETIV